MSSLPKHPLMHLAPLVGLVGKARAGKDATATFACSLYPGRTCRIGIADALKKEVAAACGVSVEYLEANKAVFRATLQAWGILKRDVFGPSYWIDQIHLLVATRRRMGQAVFIPDVRFLNEAEWIRSQGGVLVRVVRLHFGPAAPDHVSETEQDGIKVDFTIEAVDLPELQAALTPLLPQLGL